MQVKHKAYYDQKTKEMNLQPGDKVLLLLPSSTKKFIAQWQGPYTVVRCTGKVDYEIEITDKGGRKHIFHVDHLRKWKERVCTVNTVIEDGKDIEEYYWTSGIQPQFGSQLSTDQITEVKRLLSRFPQVTRNTPGQTNRAVHKIRTTDSAPIRRKAYRLPQAYHERVVKEIQEMEKNGIIEKSESEWAFPLVIVEKRDGGIRLCIDYRELNQVTKYDAYPMPRIEEMLDQIGNAHFITTLDLAKGYWQVPMSEEDKEKTAFVSPKGLFQFVTMPFGLCGAPVTFQRMIDSVLRGTEMFAGVYLDDIVVYSDTWENHLVHLEQIFHRLSDANLTMKMEKCVFAAEDCVYLGYSIGRGGVRPEESKVRDVAEMPQPQTKCDRAKGSRS